MSQPPNCGTLSVIRLAELKNFGIYAPINRNFGALPSPIGGCLASRRIHGAFRPVTRHGAVVTKQANTKVPELSLILHFVMNVCHAAQRTLVEEVGYNIHDFRREFGRIKITSFHTQLIGRKTMATPTSTSATTASVTSSDSLPSCTTAVPGKYGHVPIDACNSYYAFDPSFEGNIAFAVLFGLSFVAHITQAILYRKVRNAARPQFQIASKLTPRQRFCWVLCVGASWELIAFILRSLGARDQQQMGYQIGGQLLFLLAPLCRFLPTSLRIRSARRKSTGQV